MPNGSVLNLSRKTLWVIETDAGRAIAHKLGPNLKSPPSVDADGVKSKDGTPISGHPSWWKFRVIQVEVRDDGDALKITRCIYPACFSVADGEFGDVTYDPSDGWGVPILPHEIAKRENETLTGYRIRHAVIKEETSDYLEASYWITSGGSTPPVQPCLFQKIPKNTIFGRLALGEYVCHGERLGDTLLMIRSGGVTAGEEEKTEMQIYAPSHHSKHALDHLSPEQMKLVEQIEKDHPYEPKTTVFRTAAYEATHRVKLGTHDLPKEYRGCWRHGVDARDCWIEVWADISHPTINDFFNDALQCALGCATGAIIFAIATGAGAAAAVAAFEACFKVCLAAKVGHTVANETRIDVGTDKDCGDWSGH